MTTTGANACVVGTNVLVYSTVSGNPLIRRTFDALTKSSWRWRLSWIQAM